jgi:HAE1 family hydrophobic/amphiphilic exporter-1
MVVPLALIGLLLAPLMRGFDNNLYTQASFILLIDLACKNATLIVEIARQLQSQRMSVTEAAIGFRRYRCRPIIMTSFAFILCILSLFGASGAGTAIQQAIGSVVFLPEVIINAISHTVRIGKLCYDETLGNVAGR